MKKSAILAVSLLCLTTGAALAAGEGDGPYGPPETTASLPSGFLNGTATYIDEQEAYRAAGERAPTAAELSPDVGMAATPAPANTNPTQVAP